MSKNPHAAQPAPYEHSNAVSHGADYTNAGRHGLVKSLDILTTPGAGRGQAEVGDHHLGLAKSIKRLFTPGEGRERVTRANRGHGMLGSLAVLLVGERLATTFAEKRARDRLQEVEAELAASHQPLNTLHEMFEDASVVGEIEAGRMSLDDLQQPEIPRTPTLPELSQRAAQEATAKYLAQIVNEPTLAYGTIRKPAHEGKDQKPQYTGNTAHQPSQNTAPTTPQPSRSKP